MDGLGKEIIKKSPTAPNRLMTPAFSPSQDSEFAELFGANKNILPGKIKGMPSKLLTSP